MSERGFVINIKTSADTAGIDRTEAALSDMKGEFGRANAELDAKLAQLRGNAAAAGEQAGADLGEGVSRGAKGKGFDIEQVIGKASAVAAAAAVGVEIGTALGEAITRMAERGISWDAIMGNYDARFDESLAKWRDGINKMLEELGKPPPRTLLDYLDEVKARTAELIAQEEHLAKLRGIKTAGDRKEQDVALDQEAKDIAANERLSPEQREAAQAELQKRKEAVGYDRRQEDRNAEVEAALAKEEELGRQATAAREAKDAQQEKARLAGEFDKNLQTEWSRVGNKGKFSDHETGREWAAKERQPLGIGAADEEAARLKEAEKRLSQAQGQHATQRTARERLQEVNQAKGEEDFRETNRRRGMIDADVRDKNASRSVQAAEDAGEEARQQALSRGQQQVAAAAPPANTAAIDDAARAAEGAAEEVGTAAERLATSAADSSSSMSADIRRMTDQISSAMNNIQAAVADNSRAVAALAQRTDQAAQMAASALAAARDSRAANRPYNR